MYFTKFSLAAIVALMCLVGCEKSSDTGEVIAVQNELEKWAEDHPYDESLDEEMGK